MISPSPLLTPMAVEAYHLHQLAPQILMDRELAFGMVKDARQPMFSEADTGFIIPTFFHNHGVPFTGGSNIDGNNTSFPGEGNFTGASIVIGKNMSIYGDGGFNRASRVVGKKRTFCEAKGFLSTSSIVGRKQLKDTPLYFFGEVPSAHFQQNMLNDPQFFRQTQLQPEKAEVAKRREILFKKLAATIENQAEKRLKGMDDELKEAIKLNWILEERVHNLSIETQIWRELAQSAEMSAILLRADLDQIISNQAYIDREQQQCAVEDVDDAESCCGDNEASENIAAALSSQPAATCRICGVKEPTVLLLPCRHLCICASCGPTTNFCPICNCFTAGTVNVNLP